MKSNKYIIWALGLIALFTGCADNDFSEPYRPWDGEVPEELNIIVKIGDPELVSFGETRADDGTINSLTVMQYDKNGDFLGALTPTLKKENGQYKINVKLDKNVSQLQFAANHTVSTGCSNLATEIVSSALPSTASDYASWNPVLWGKVKLSEVLSSADRYEPEIVLYRQVAKVTVKNSASNFTLEGFGVYNTAEKGTVGPVLANFEAGNPTIASGVTNNAKIENLAADGVAYVYETAKESSSNIPKVIVSGKIDGKTYYYVAGFRKRTGNGSSDNAGDGKYIYTPIDILRNHHYDLEIQSVRGEGWPSLEEAIAAIPDNRITVWVSDINEEINNMVASRDYLLGVKDKITTTWNGVAKITVVSSYPDIDSNPIKITCVDDAITPWIKVDNITIDSETIGSDNASGTAKTVKKIVYNVPLLNNDKQTFEREGEIIIRVGDLSRKVTIIQEGRDLRRERGAEIYGLTGVTDGTSYYNWVDNTCKGLRPQDNRGLDRNNALIFAAVPAFGEGIYYKIPKKFPGEEGLDVSYSLDNNTDFVVTEESGNWVVKAKDNSQPKLAVAKLTLSCSNGAVIDYDLLQVGYFHELKATHKQYTKGDYNAGWYYYEVVEINGYYLLDRNIGASTNNSFDPTNINYSEEDEKAKGCYFVVNPIRASFNTTDKDLRYQDLKTVTENLGMNYGTNKKFCIPTETEFTNMGFRQNRNIGAGAVNIEVSNNSQVSDKKIFIPAAGYYFGNILKNITHVNIWTRSLLAGSQGLMESDEEYGYQYRYLNIVGGIIGYQNLRTSAGAGGSLNENLRNYLPLRLVWSKSSSVTPPIPVTNYKYAIHGSIFSGNKDSWSPKAMSEQADGTWTLTTDVVGGNQCSFGIRPYESNINDESHWIWSSSSSATVSLDSPMSCVEQSGNNGANWGWGNLGSGNFTFTFNPSANTLEVTKNVSTPIDNAKYYIDSNYNGSWGLTEMSKSGSICSVTIQSTQDFNFLIKKEENNNWTEIKDPRENTTIEDSDLGQWLNTTSTDGANFWVPMGSNKFTISYDISKNQVKIDKL